MNDLLNKILILVPGAMCQVQDLSNTNIDDGRDQYILNGFRVQWSRLNTSPCPTQEQIDGVNLGN